MALVERGSEATGQWKTALHTQHPGIADELQNCINTLRKLQEFTGPTGMTQGPFPQLPGAAPAAPAANGRGSTGHDETLEGPAATPAVRGENHILAARESFGRYQIVRQLGHGAMGAVYLAYDSQLERHVALKTPFLGGNATRVTRFYREARTAAKIRSPYVCAIYDVGQVGEIHYLSMAFIDGATLGKAMRDGLIKEPPTMAQIVANIARGLQKAHEQGVIHRDLKPENIMLDSDGNPIVTDFGLARHVEDEAHLTGAGMPLGTPAYMSPEQVTGDSDQIGPASDIYSLGVVLYEMLCGRVPFQGPVLSVLQQVQQKQPQRPTEIAQGRTPDPRLEEICMKMIAKSPTDRFASMADVVGVLSVPTATADSESQAPRGRSGVWSGLGRLFGRRDQTG